jgi:hypothetical protein
MNLLNRVNPKLYESLYSFLFRNVTANYFHHLATIISEHSALIYKSNCNYIEEKCVWLLTFKSFTDSLNVDINNFVLNQFNDIFFGQRRIGKMIDKRVYDKYKTKYCPSCLQDDFYHRIYWDISFVTTCVTHDCFLIERCTHCSKKITMSNLMQDACSCGQNFTNMKAAVPSKIIMETQKTVQQILLDSTQHAVSFCDGRTLGKTNYFFLFLAFCSIIDNLPGELFNRQTCIYKPVINYKFVNKEERDVLMMSLITVVAHQLVSQPYQYLEPLLTSIDKMKEEMGKSRTMNLKRYHTLRTIIQSEAGAIYYNCYSEYVNKLAFESFNKRMIRPNTAQKRYLSTTEAIKIIRKDFNVITHFCDIGILTAHRTTTNSLLIESSSIERYFYIKNNSYSMGQLCKYLGIHYVRAVELFDNGLLTAYWGPKSNGYKLWHFNIERVHAFLEDVLSQSNAVQTPPLYHLPLKAFLNLAVPLGLTFTEIIKMIIEGTLSTVYLQSVPNLKGIYIPVKQSTELVKKI